MSSRNATARLEARLPAHTHALLKRAAEIQGRSLTDFVVGAAQEAATRVIEDHEVITLNVEDSRRFVEALLNPPPLTPAMERALQRRKALMDAE